MHDIWIRHFSTDEVALHAENFQRSKFCVASNNTKFDEESDRFNNSVAGYRLGYRRFSLYNIDAQDLYSKFKLFSVIDSFQLLVFSLKMLESIRNQNVCIKYV